MQNPIQAIVQHSEHNVLYAQDPLMQGFHSRHISHMLDIVCENQGQTGFSVAEVGAGTGGFTRQVCLALAQLCLKALQWEVNQSGPWTSSIRCLRLYLVGPAQLVDPHGGDVTCLQVIAELDRSPFSELRSYTATDITPAFGPNLLQLVNNSKLEFKVHPAVPSKHQCA